MDNTASSNRLRDLEHSEKTESRQEKTEIRETTKIQKATSEVVQPLDRGVEFAEGSEAGAELSEGKVSEGLGEDKKKGPTGQFAGAHTADEIEAIRAKLLQNLPAPDVMVRQIRQSLQKREKILTLKYKKLRKMGHKAAFQLNVVVAQLRKAREFFAMLADATFEVLKQLWLKIVHGV